MENFKLLSERLTWAVSRRIAMDVGGPRITKKRMAEEAGVSPPAVNYWFSDTNGIQGEQARKLAKFLLVDPVWLEKGEGSPERTLFPGLAGARQVVVLEQDAPEFVQIPMVELRLQAGVTGFQTELDQREGGTLGMRRSWIERTGLNPESLIAIHVKGDSMEPSLYEDDVVVLNTADRKPADGAVFAVNYEGEAVVKRFSRDAGDWWLTSDNPDQRKHHRKLCRGEACIIIGRVVRKESDRI